MVLLYKCRKLRHKNIWEKSYFRDLIGHLISFTVCSRRRQDYRIVYTISISIQNLDFDCSEFTPESIVSTGEKSLVYRPMCKGRLTDNLDSLRYTMFCQKVASSKLYIKPEACHLHQQLPMAVFILQTNYPSRRTKST